MSLLAALTIKVSAILLLALIGTLCLRGSSASAKHWVLAVGVVAAVAAPALDVLPIPPVVRMAPVGPLVFDALRPGSYVLFTEPAAGAGVAELAAASQRPAAAVVASGDVVGRMAVTIWLLGAVASVGVLLVGLARLRWLRASSSRVTDGRWHRLCADLARSCGLRRGADLVFGPLPGLMATWGWRRPVVMLPASAFEWSAERMRVVLLHELAHARRGDWMLQMAAEALRCVWWFNPLAWMVRARLRRESEHAADDLVLAQGVPGTTCAAHLVELAREVRRHRRTWLPAPAMARPSHLERRLSAMLNPRTNRRPMTRLARCCSLGVLVLVSIVVAGLHSGAVTAAQDTMFRVDYVKTRTLGATVVEREEGTHTFAPTGHRRMDRMVDGERTTTEIVVPGAGGGGSQIVIDYSLGVVRTGPLNVATGAQASMPPELLDLVAGGQGPELPPGAQVRVSAPGHPALLDSLPPGVPLRVVSRTRSVTRDGASAPLRHVGEEVRGPLTLRHSRAELPNGVTVDFWDYRFPNFNPVVDLGPGLTLAESWRSTTPDGTPELQETRILNVSEVEFDPDAFSLDPSLGFRVEDLWDVLAR